MQTAEFQKELEAVRKNEEERLTHQKKLDEAAEVRRRRSCMERPKIDFVPKGLYVDLEAAYSKYFQQVVTFMPEDRDDFMYMLRLLERWEKKSVPAVLAKGRPDAAYAIAIELCKNLELLLMHGDMEEYIREYKLRIAKLIHASFVALVDSGLYGTTRKNVSTCSIISIPICLDLTTSRECRRNFWNWLQVRKS